MNELIRCESRRYSVTIDADLDLYGVSGPELSYQHFTILRRTPKGAWIYTGGYYSSGFPYSWEEVDREYRRFVLLTATKQYASETEEEAREQFAYRKRRQIKILSQKLRRAEEDLSLVVAQ